MAFKEVWLAVRADNIAGDGTPGNPYDASNETKFDALMRGFYNDLDPVPYYIHLEPGTFFTKGGYVNSSTGWKMNNGWVIAGAGIGATTVQLKVWSDSGGGKHYVIGTASADLFENLVVRNLTVDANWDGLSGKPPNGQTSVLSIAINTIGNATVENVRSINTYGDLDSQKECFSIFLSHAANLDSNDLPQHSTLAIRNCIAEDGHGNYVVGMTAFSLHMVDMRGNVCRNLPNGSPPSAGHPYGKSPSAAYQFTVRGIVFTENQSYNCPAPLYFDTGNIRDVLIANNAFFGCRWAGLLSYPGSAMFLAINVRQAGASLDGKFVDVPIKPSGGSDNYRVRVWLGTADKSWRRWTRRNWRTSRRQSTQRRVEAGGR